MGDGAIAAAFRGLAADAAKAARNIVESVGRIAEKTADIEEANLRSLLDSDSRAAESFKSLGSTRGRDMEPASPCRSSCPRAWRG